MRKLSNFIFPLIFTAGMSLPACAQAPSCGRGSTTNRFLANAKVINIHIFGTDDRQAEEDFNKPENLEAQRILGLREIKHSISAVVPVECFYTAKNGQAYRYEFNGSLVCDHETLLINAHSLQKSLCEDTKDNFVCRIPKTSEYPEIFINKPTAKQIKAKDLCSKSDIPYDDDVAVVKLYEPSPREPIKIGTVSSFNQVKNRRFVNVAANVSENYKGPQSTEKTFLVSSYDEINSSSTARAEMDGGPGSSGSVHLIKQDGELLTIGINEGGYGRKVGNNSLQDGRAYSPKGNYSRELFFNKDIQSFLKKNIKNPQKCFRDVRPENEVSI